MASDSEESTEKETTASEPATEPKAEPATSGSATKAPSAASKPSGTASKPKSGAAKGKRPAPKKSGFSMRNVILFGGLVVLLLAAFGLLGNRDQGGPTNAPKWKLNEPVDVEITLVQTDANDLGCAMEGDVAGLHCAYTAPNAKNAAAGATSRDDDKLLQPYATTNHQNFFAAAVWTQADTKDAVELDKKIKALPNPRFTLACKFTPRGRAKAAKVQWKPGTEWGDGSGWYVGDVKDCRLLK